MTDSTQVITPGTVSKILWHFTGGPTWNTEKDKQNITPKPANDAYQCLIKIIESKELKIGNYSEIVKVKLKLKSRSVSQKKLKRKYVEKTRKIRSKNVCCLADIPLIHLGYHSYRYGKFAIGFHRDSAIKNNFNPVLYSLENSKALKSIYKGFSNLKNIDIEDLKTESTNIKETFNKCHADNGESLNDAFADLDYEIDYLDTHQKNAIESISHFLAFVKTFDDSEFGSIYTEREWRSTEPFPFDYEDLAMIVLPKKVGANKYYEEFLNEEIEKIGIPKEIPVVPWEDLVEH